jgi:hypothetical protein
MKHKSYYHLIATLLIGSILSPLQASLVDTTEQEGEPKALHQAPVTVIKEITPEESDVKETKTSTELVSETEKVLEDDKETPKVVLTTQVQEISPEQLLIFTSLNKIIELGSAEHSTLNWMKSWVPPYNYQSHFQAVEKIEKKMRKLLKKDSTKVSQSDYEEFKGEAFKTISSDAVEVFASPIVDEAHKMYVRFSMNKRNIEEDTAIVFEKLRFFKKIAIMNTVIMGGLDDMRMEFNRQNILAIRTEQLRIAKETESKQVIITQEPQEGTSIPSSSGVTTDDTKDIVKEGEKKPEEVKKDIDTTGESK